MHFMNMTLYIQSETPDEPWNCDVYQMTSTVSGCGVKRKLNFDTEKVHFVYNYTHVYD